MKHVAPILKALCGLAVLPFQLATVIFGAIVELIATVFAALAGVTILGAGAIALLMMLAAH